MSWKLRDYYRKRLAGEQGTVFKDPGGRIRVALLYPNRYHIGMSNLGFQSLYGWLNEQEDIVCERAFLPDDNEMALYDRSGASLLTMESQTEVSRNDVLAFSISFENDYLYVLKLLDLARVPLLSSQRNGPGPLVMAGGIAVSLNPEPLAPFFDLLALGDGERLVPELIGLLRETDSITHEREPFLKQACRLPGLYVPSFYREHYREDGAIEGRDALEGAPEHVTLARTHPFSDPIPQTSITTPDTEFSNTALLEIGKGCGRGCRFCAAGYLYRPPRSHSEDRVFSALTALHDSVSRFGLVCPALGDLPEVVPILQHIHRMGAEATTSSLRGDAAGDELLSLLRACGQKSVAIAPEAGSQRLRNVLNKKLSEDEITAAVARLTEAGLSSIKLYFMVGLPTETIDDVDAIHTLLKRIVHTLKKLRKKDRGLPRIGASINCFVPKARTPFQWEPMDRVDALKKKLRRIQGQMKSARSVSFSAEVPKWSYIQAFLSQGDRRAGQVLAAVHANEGRWWETFKHVPFNPDFFVYRRKEYAEILPWDFVQTGVQKEFLVAEHIRAMKGRTSPDCVPESCNRCGLCGSDSVPGI